jgi:hypothetical protein
MNLDDRAKTNVVTAQITEDVTALLVRLLGRHARARRASEVRVMEATREGWSGRRNVIGNVLKSGLLIQRDQSGTGVVSVLIRGETNGHFLKLRRASDVAGPKSLSQLYERERPHLIFGPSTVTLVPFPIVPKTGTRSHPRSSAPRH